MVASYHCTLYRFAACNSLSHHEGKMYHSETVTVPQLLRVPACGNHDKALTLKLTGNALWLSDLNPHAPSRFLAQLRTASE